MTVWVVGGEQKPQFREGPGWKGFKAAVVVEVDGGQVRRVFEYQSRPEHTPEEPSHHFTAATFVGSTGYLCTPTEVLICRLPDFRVDRVISLPCFNDLHHVVPGPNGNLFVAVTGLDAVAELTPDGELVRLTDVMGGSVWDRFDRTVDYRKVPSTKPHRAHPCYVFFLDEVPWVTRGDQHDAVALDGSGRRIAVHHQNIHDGHVQDDEVLFTGVDGHLVWVNARTGARQAMDLNPVSGKGDMPLGWCRGLFARDGSAWVGFTRVRFTNLRKNLSWIKNRFGPTMHDTHLGSRIALYDLREPRLLEEVYLEDARVNAVFSIHPKEECRT